jgi:hypothetical protein
MDADAPATQDVTRRRTFMTHAETVPGGGSPGELGAARCPVPTLRPRPWPGQVRNIAVPFTMFYQPPHDVNHHQPGPW